MPTWQTKLPPEGKHHGFDLRRTPQSSRLVAIITCESLCVCDTHFWHGRTIPCERIVNDEGKTIDDTPCRSCEEKQSWRTHVYVSAFDGKTREHFIFECTANAAKPLQDYFQATGTLRGCIFAASRPKGGPNSKVVIETNTANLSRVQLPNPPDVPKALSVIWRLPQTAILLEERPFEQPTIRPSANRLTEMRQQPDNSGIPPRILEQTQGNGRSRKPQKAK